MSVCVCVCVSAWFSSCTILPTCKRSRSCFEWLANAAFSRAVGREVGKRNLHRNHVNPHVVNVTLYSLDNKKAACDENSCAVVLCFVSHVCSTSIANNCGVHASLKGAIPVRAAGIFHQVQHLCNAIRPGGARGSVKHLSAPGR